LVTINPFTQDFTSQSKSLHPVPVFSIYGHTVWCNFSIIESDLTQSHFEDIDLEPTLGWDVFEPNCRQRRQTHALDNSGDADFHPFANPNINSLLTPLQ
jgi:hypothetical protein